ncbi:hypothetical protein ES703_83862 [subsurface metagenome]
MASNVSIDPYDDWYAEGFYRASNEFPIALIQGNPVHLARDRCIAKYNEWINIWETERADDPLAADAIKWLIYDRDGLTVLGDTEAIIIAAGIPTTMVVDVEPPTSANSGETFSFAGRLFEKDTGNPLAGKTVNLRVNGVQIATSTTGVDGGWTFDVVLTARVHHLYAEFPGDAEYAPGYTRDYTVEVGLTKMRVSVRPPTSLDPGQTFLFSGSLMSGATGVPNKTINLWQSGVETPIATATTAGDGGWHFDVTINTEGHYLFYAEFPGDSDYTRTLTDKYMVAVGELPIFGCTEVGNYLSGIVNEIEGFVFECPEDGIAESISVYLQAGYATGRVKCAIYRADDLSLVAATEERTFYGEDGRFFDWRRFVFPSLAQLTANTKYILAAWASAGASIFMVPGDPEQRLIQPRIPYNNFPDFLNPSERQPYKAAIYCSYRSAVPPPPEYTLTISSTTGGTTDPAPGPHTYPEGTVAKVTAYPDSGYLFDHWELDGVARTENPIDVLMDRDHTIHAVFVAIPPPEYTLTISTTTGGTTDPTPSVYTHPEGTVVRVTALPASGYRFSHWEIDSVVRTENPIDVTMDRNYTLRAVFEAIPPPEYTLTISVTGAGSTDPAPGQYIHPEGTIARVTAFPAPGFWEFDHWELDGEVRTENPIDVLMDRDHTLHAVFVAAPPPERMLTISTTVGGTTDPAPGSYYYPDGSVAMVIAYPDMGYLFDHWLIDGVTRETENPISLLMDKDHTLQAVFIEAPPVPPPPKTRLLALSIGVAAVGVAYYSCGFSSTFTSKEASCSPWSPTLLCWCSRYYSALGLSCSGSTGISTTSSGRRSRRMNNHNFLIPSSEG